MTTDRSQVASIADHENLIRVLDSLKEGIIAHDLDRRIFFFNAEAERITGYNRREVVGQDCHQVFGAPFCGQRCSFCDGSPHQVDYAEYPLNIISKTGEPRRIEFRATMMRNHEGDFTGVVAAFTDVTELIALQQRSAEMHCFGNIIGNDPKMRGVFRQITDVAQYDFPVHIYGETGTGKELVANAIHNESRRGGAPFVPINCGALPEGLIESELFGHVKGAFSGAIRDKKGRFELADGGTVFLDEVADLPKLLQVKLLRFLQEGRFEKVGAEKTVQVDVRVISATNKQLKNQVQEHHFREDLFYRLNVIPMRIPPLRERPNDIPLLVNHVLNQVSERNGKTMPIVNEAAMAAMLDYSWPGNVRELQNAVQFALVRCNGRTITQNDLPLELRHLQSPTIRRGPQNKLAAESVREALIKTGGNKARAARLLGVGRATLYRFLSRTPIQIHEADG
jgi:PAS domain S-box-containing protein